MQDGIYHVNFSSNANDFGQGIAVFKDGSVNGGDHGYLYTGTKTSQGDRFSSTLTIKQWNPSVQSVFGPAKQFELVLEGSVSGDGGFIAQGHVAGQPQAKITIKGRHLSTAS
jgi:hypothetical protein